MLATLLGSSLKFDGRFILQTPDRRPGVVPDRGFQAPDMRLRAYARFDATRLKRRPGSQGAARQGPPCA